MYTVFCMWIIQVTSDTVFVINVILKRFYFSRLPHMSVRRTSQCFQLAIKVRFIGIENEIMTPFSL